MAVETSDKKTSLAAIQETFCSVTKYVWDAWGKDIITDWILQYHFETMWYYQQWMYVLDVFKLACYIILPHHIQKKILDVSL